MTISFLSPVFSVLLNSCKAKRRSSRITLTNSSVEALEERTLLAAVDSNDQLSEAYNIGNVNQTRTITGFTIEDNTDVDMMRFTVNAGQRITFDIDRPSGSLDSVIRLFDSTGRQLAINDDGAAPGEARSVESFLDYTFATGGTYYLGVSGFGNSTYNPLNGTGDRPSRTGAFTLQLIPVDTNDQIHEAFGLGALTTTRTGSGFSIETATDVDMFSFTVNGGQRIGFDIDRPSGSLDSFIRLFDSSGRQIAFNDDATAPGESFSVESYLEYTFTTPGTYFLGVSGFGNQGYNPITGSGDTAGRTGAFTLTARPLSSSPTPTPGRNVLYMNFEGTTISNSQLRTWAGTDWAGSINSYLDPEGDGIRVIQFMAGRTDREAIISGVMTRVQADLNAYGITVQRVTGMGAVGVGATTLFFGDNNMQNGIGHVACDVDFNNNNRTDIAFIETETNWGSQAAIISAMADVALHEAGHTYGLFHVQVVQSGVIHNETMGLRYSTNQSEWTRDTRFLDRTFTEYLDHGGLPGTQSQNAHRTMLTNFGLPGGSPRASTEPRFSTAALRSIMLADAQSGHADHDHDMFGDHDDDHDDHDDETFGTLAQLSLRGANFGSVHRLLSQEEQGLLAIL